MQVTEYRCDTCGMGFENQEQLDRHERDEHQSGRLQRYRCPSCGDEFNTEILLNAHLAVHR